MVELQMASRRVVGTLEMREGVFRAGIVVSFAFVRARAGAWVPLSFLVENENEDGEN